MNAREPSAIATFIAPRGGDGADATFKIGGGDMAGMVQIDDGYENIVVTLDAIKQFVAWMAREGIAV